MIETERQAYILLGREGHHSTNCSSLIRTGYSKLAGAMDISVMPTCTIITGTNGPPLLSPVHFPILQGFVDVRAMESCSQADQQFCAVFSNTQ